MNRSIKSGFAAGMGVVLVTAGLTAAWPAAGQAQTGTAFRRVDLVSDQPGKAATVDPNLVNAWGMSRGPNSPIWVSDNGSDVSTLYSGAVGSTPVSTLPLVVSTPGGAPTGQIFNDTTSFVVPGTTSPALFVFAGENGDLSAWNPTVPSPTRAVRVRHVAQAVYKGLALVHGTSGPLLLAANFHSGRVDVFNAAFRHVANAGRFTDSRLPGGYAPFNVTEIENRVVVTYAKQDADAHDDVAGAGHGLVDVFTQDGMLLHRLSDRAVLNSPWGLAVAPASFGDFAGALLVGNFGDGRIHAFDLRTGQLQGTMMNRHGTAMRIPGLWGLLVGDAVAGGPDSVWFSAGPGEEAHGLLGVLRSA